MRYKRNVYRYNPKRRHIRKRRLALFIVVVAAAVIAVFFAVQYFSSPDRSEPEPTAAPSASAQAAATPIPEEAHAVGGTFPSDFGLTYEVMENGEIVSGYVRQQGIFFPSAGSEETEALYTPLKGITTFRGNNYRNEPAYGTAEVTEKKLESLWNIDSGALTRWTGSGYTGQPLIVQWDDSMRQIMNLYPEKKAEQNLTEVIYPTMDGKIYFLDLEDGTLTRDPIDMGFTVKGTASIDPRGYPILYVGQSIGNSGDNSWDDSSIHIYSLIDGNELYKYGFEDKDPFSFRDSWQAWDSSPLVSADTDTLIWPGENGVLYTFKLNSSFVSSAGTVNVSPDEPVKYRYTTSAETDGQPDQPEVRCYGIESSAAAYMNWLFFTDNCGLLQCVDMNAMAPVWVQDVTDDSDATCALQKDESGLYLYTGCEIDKAVRAGDAAGTAFARKVDALTGEIVWEASYECYAVAGSDSGILASPAVGQDSLEGLVFYTVARTGSDEESGLMVALNQETGEEAWRLAMDAYAWSSPVPVYAGDGAGYIIQCDSGGSMRLIDGLTGEVLDTLSLESSIEATPAVFGDIAVVGTRGEKIYGVKIK